MLSKYKQISESKDKRDIQIKCFIGKIDTDFTQKIIIKYLSLSSLLICLFPVLSGLFDPDLIT